MTDGENWEKKKKKNRNVSEIIIIRLLFLSFVGPIEFTMYSSSSFVMRLSSFGDSAIHVSQMTHQIIAMKPKRTTLRLKLCAICLDDW